MPTPHRRYRIAHNGRSTERELFHFYEGELAGLSPRQREVLELRAGLVDGEPQTLEQVGHELGIGKERVRQIQFRALWRCREQREGSRTAATSVAAPAGKGATAGSCEQMTIIQPMTT